MHLFSFGNLTQFLNIFLGDDGQNKGGNNAGRGHQSSGQGFNFNFGGAGAGGGFGGFGGFPGGGGGFGGFGGGFPGGGGRGAGGGSRQQQSRPPAPNVFTDKDGVHSLSSSKYPDSKSRFIWYVVLRFINMRFSLQQYLFNHFELNRVIIFYDPRDERIPNIKDKFIKLASTLKQGGVKTGAVNCEREQELCRKHGGVGSVSMVHHLTRVPYQGDLGNFNPKSLFDFVNEKAPGDVANLRLSTQANDFVLTRCGNKKTSSFGIGLILFTSKFETPLMLKTLSFALSGKVAVGEVRGGNENLTREFGLTYAYPMLVAVCGGKEKLANEIYTGDMKDISSIEKFAQEFVSPQKCQNLQKKAQKEKERRQAQKKSVSSLTEQELNKKRVSELREIVEDLSLSTAGMLEKGDYIRSILEHNSRIKQEL